MLTSARRLIVCLIVSLVVWGTSDAQDRLVSRAAARPKQSTKIAVGETAATSKAETKRVALEGGAIAYLNQNSKLRYSEKGNLVVEAGEVVVEAPKGSALRVKVGSDVMHIDDAKAVIAAAPSVLVLRGQASGEGTTGEFKLKAGERRSGGKIEVAPRASHVLEWMQPLLADAALVPASEFAGGSLVAKDADGRDAKITLRDFHVDVHIEDGFARTTIDQTYFNHDDWPLEGTFYFPLPADASLSHLAMYVNGVRREASMVERNRARDVYETIRYANRDPALLEWVDGTTFKMRVFPLEPRTEKRIVLSYVQRLPNAFGETRYCFPAGHSLQTTDRWSLHVHVVGGDEMTWKSPSHELTARRVGADLFLEASAKNAKTGRDVVLTLQVAGATLPLRVSTVKHDGAEYLMLRYRPTMPSQQAPGKRHWAILFESTGDRDPLLARAQIETIRHLLANLDPADTFQVYAAGTRTRAASNAPQSPTPEAIRESIAFLEKAHLVGALDLAKAFTCIQNPGGETMLVHVGSGFAVLGERRADELIKMLPTGIRYVGVGVGRRWDHAFMKRAAEKTGGTFIHVNPDEPLAWRAFELLATLNAPRLLNLSVTATNGGTGLDQFLQPANAASRNPVAAQQSEGLPRFLVMNESINQGEEIVAITRVGPTIAAKPQAPIIENATIKPTTGFMLPTQVRIEGVIHGSAKEPLELKLPLKKARPDAGSLPRLWAKLEIDRLLAEDPMKNRDAIIELSKTMYVMSPFTSLLVLESDDQHAQFKIANPRKDHWAPYACPEKIEVVVEPKPGQPDPRLAGQKPTPMQAMRTVNIRGQKPESQSGQQQFRFWVGLDRDATSPKRNQSPLYADIGFPIKNSSFDFAAPPYGGLPQDKVGRVIIIGNEVSDERVIRRTFGRTADEANFLHSLADEPDSDSPLDPRLRFRGRYSPIRYGARLESDAGLVGSIVITERNLSRQSLFEDKKVVGDTVGWLGMSVVIQESLTPAGTLPLSGDGTLLYQRPIRYADGGFYTSIESVRGKQGTDTLLYQRPTFGFADNTFFDLIAYAPGLNSSLADVEAVIEAEARPTAASRVGAIDERAAALLQKARVAGWRTWTVGDATLAFDGGGRFAYERILPSSIKERVECLGDSLVHIYPLLSLGAKRGVSRFHRLEWCDRVPFVVPAADDLARGADVKLVAANIVAVVPHGSGEEGAVQLQFVFDGDRLIEKRWIGIEAQQAGKPAPQPKTLLRQTLDAKGTVRLLDGEGKELATVKGELREAPAPTFTQDFGQTVLLPLPYRPVEHIRKQLKIEKKADNELTLAEALPVFASYFGAGDAAKASNLFERVFVRFEQKPLGMYVLLAALGQSLDSQNLDVVAEYPDSSLAQYLGLHSSPILRQHASQWAVQSAPWGDGFLGRLGLAHALLQRWGSDKINKLTPAQLKQERAKALDFVRAQVKDHVAPLAWDLLCRMQDRTPADKTDFHPDLATAFGLFETHPTLGDAARYERARCLLRAGDRVAAENIYRDVFDSAAKAGRLPLIDTSFRAALEPSESWSKALHAAAGRFIEKKQRAAVLALAWQAWQLQDAALSQSLFDRALTGVEDAKQKDALRRIALGYLWRTNQIVAADELLAQLLAENPSDAGLWRVGVKFAERRHLPARSLECLEKSLELEYRNLPEVLNVQAIDESYQDLLGRYRALAEAMTTLKLAPQRGFVDKVIAAADHWRALSADNDTPSTLAADILARLGDKTRSWDYRTTPLARKPHESTAIWALASSLVTLGDRDQADAAFESAAAAEPTNPQILWDRADNLRRLGRTVAADAIVRQIAEGQWQPRFQGLVNQAKARRGS